jgi:hypothetical protein
MGCIRFTSGTRIFTAFTQTPLSSPTYMQSQQNGTSFAAPIVSGIAAILLSKNPSLTEAQIRAAIQGNTDKVKPFNNGNYALYSFLPGYSDEAFKDRVESKDPQLERAIKELLSL